MAQVVKIYKAVDAHMGDLITYRALPTQYIDYIDPFLFLNHHGPQVYKPHNRGLPFGPHPHRGMETVTFMIDGDISHKDNSGHESVIGSGGIQYMRAGRGVIHSEVSSDEFKQNGGPLEILQLWLNLPARLKMSEPFYIGKQKEEIPVVKSDDGRVEADLIFGDWDGQKAALESETGLHFNVIRFQPEGKITITVPAGNNIFFYVVRGEVTANGTAVKALHLAEFDTTGGELTLSADTESIVLFGYAHPFNEPIVAQGPFVMNTEQEIVEAYRDYQMGKFGDWQH
ncbi:pirin family protein [Mucilaginibacter sp. KACC 22063]|uniref:pirin family protein n=1 Tax=Mucilaginibacter sp. KACC 22063 TaxID=3025666 RepID=UPI002366538B|nr:pirin family protein [Mucilaginibacter sp. KACC 22063]WDF56605.1 pirin family protein [Mucilaginibacter sp. KACC 22063]